MRVIVTRPEPEAERWAQALGRHGLDAVALPLISIRPMVDAAPLRAAWRQLRDCTAVMFVSVPAVEHFFAARQPGDPAPDDPALAMPRFWAPGPGTGAALLRQGVPAHLVDAPAADSAQFDSEALWQVAGGRVRAGDKVLIVRGSDDGGGTAPEQSAVAAPGGGRDWLARTLETAQAQVQELVAYRRGAPRWEPAERELARAAARDGSIWLFTSSQAIANLDRCLPCQSWREARAVATHPRISDAARAAGFGVVWESRPAVAEVVASIESNAS